jgi:hypothetical protein
MEEEAQKPASPSILASPSQPAEPCGVIAARTTLCKARFRTGRASATSWGEHVGAWRAPLVQPLTRTTSPHSISVTRIRTDSGVCIKRGRKTV